MGSTARPEAARGAPVAPGRPRLIVTRPRAQADDWVARLRALAVDAVALPLLDTSPAVDRPAFEAALAELPHCALVMFVSPNAVAHWRAALPAGWAWPAGVWAGATGPGTVAALQAAGVPADAIVSPPAEGGQYDTEALWATLAPRRAWPGARVQVVRGVGGRDWLANTLRAAGAQLRFVEVYRRQGPPLDAGAQALLAEALARPSAHLWLFSSSEAVGQLPALAPGADWSTSRALATHARIAAAVRSLGWGPVALVLPTPEAVAQALEGAPIESGGT